MNQKTFHRRFILFLFIILFLSILFLQHTKADNADKLPVVIQELVKPPFVPTHNIVAKGGPKLIKVRIEVKLLNIYFAIRPCKPTKN